jgi:hypothetical protein
MTEDGFRELCEQVMVPKVSNLLHRALADEEEILGAIVKELMHVRDIVEALVSVLRMRDDHEDIH